MRHAGALKDVLPAKGMWMECVTRVPYGCTVYRRPRHGRNPAACQWMRHKGALTVVMYVARHVDGVRHLCALTDALYVARQRG